MLLHVFQLSRYLPAQEASPVSSTPHRLSCFSSNYTARGQLETARVTNYSSQNTLWVVLGGLPRPLGKEELLVRKPILIVLESSDMRLDPPCSVGGGRSAAAPHLIPCQSKWGRKNDMFGPPIRHACTGWDPFSSLWRRTNLHIFPWSIVFVSTYQLGLFNENQYPPSWVYIMIYMKFPCNLGW